MRKTQVIFILLFCSLSIAIISCKKESPLQGIVSSLTMVNAVVDANPYLIADLKKGTNAGFYYALGLKLRYGVSDLTQKLPVEEEVLPLAFFLFPDTMASSKPLYDLKLQIPKGSISSLFLVGDLSHPDYALVTATPPAHLERDSTFGIRFANLSYQSKPVSVSVITDTQQQEAEKLSYKGVTAYKKYAALSKTGDLTVQFKDQETQRLLATYVITGLAAISDNPWRYKNFTLALKGLPGSTDAIKKQSVFIISDY